MRDDVFPVYAQGARCGHIEGKERVGLYVIGEELELSNEAAENQGRSGREFLSHWAAGYRYGYMLGVQGETLDEWIVEAELPQ